LDEDEKLKVDAEIDELTEEEGLTERKRIGAN
jgi:hypothetical protein